MNRKLSPERRKVAVLAGSVAAGSGLIGLISQHHPSLAIAWMVVMFALMVYVIMQLVKLKKQRIRR